MNGAEHQVAGLGRMHRRVECLAITHLTHQDDVGVLADGVLERRIPVHHIDPHFTLIDDALVVLECEFDRVFNRDDVATLARVHILEHRGDARRFTRARDARQNDNSLIVAGDLAHDRRKAQPLEIRNRGVHTASHQAQPPALFEQVDAKPGLVAVGFEDDVREVDAAGLVEDGFLAHAEQGKHQPFHLGPCERRKLHQPQHSGQAHRRRHPHLEVKVRALEPHHHPEQLVRLGLIGHRVNGCFSDCRHGDSLLRLPGLENCRQGFEQVSWFSLRDGSGFFKSVIRTGTPRLARYSFVSRIE